MMEHTWTILEEKIIPEHLGELNVVATIWFRLSSVEGEKSAKTDGRINLDTSNLENFIGYDSLDLATRIQWIKSHAGEFYEEINAAKIVEQI
jgi:hypothetical protein